LDETDSATPPTPFIAPAANDGGATQAARVVLELDAGAGGASPKRHRRCAPKFEPVISTRVWPATGPRAGATPSIDGAATYV
jgi:hypothetical protein